MKHTPSQKVISAIVANGAGVVNMRQAVRMTDAFRMWKATGMVPGQEQEGTEE